MPLMQCYLCSAGLLQHACLPADVPRSVGLLHCCKSASRGFLHIADHCNLTWSVFRLNCGPVISLLLIVLRTDVQPVEVYVDDESKLTLHGLVQHYTMLSEDGKNKRLMDLLDQLDFNQVHSVKNQP